MKRIAAILAGVVGTIAFVHCGTDSSGNGDQPPPGDDGGADATTSPGDDGSTPATGCGNGVVESPEECDNGAKNAPGSGCERDCTFSCVAGETGRGDDHCNDGNACNGVETCAADHSCKSGTPLNSGDPCDTGKVCNGGNCVAATCGDGIVTSPEECDDGNATNGDGCDTTCKLSCVSTDATRNCAGGDVCAGVGTCNDTTHVCTPGTPLADGTGCGAGGDAGASDAAAGSVCKGGVCTAPSCGDGVVQSGEDCDFGAGNGAGTGCEINCKFSCTKGPDSCVTTDLCAGTNTCTTFSPSDAGSPGQKCVLGAPPPDGTTCPNGGTCQSHVCKTSNCGNGTVDTGEDCDFGSGNNVTGSGCEPNCKFSCQITPTDTCTGTDLCLASPVKCGAVTVNGKGGQKCGPVVGTANCGACTSGGTSGVCVGNKCSAAKCGDGCVTGKETCDPPNGTTCDAQCNKVACGDGVLAAGEQCDDGNKTNLDGCDSTCKFEQDHRADSVVLKFTTDKNVCPKNALGGAIGTLAQGLVQGSLNTGVWDGTTTIAFKFLGLDDLSGTAQDGGLSLGAMSGAPIIGGKAYDGGADLDWWYTTADASISPDRTPLSIMPATLSKKTLTATGAVDISIVIAGGLANLHMSGTTIVGNVGSTSKPKASTDSNTPGHLPSEHLDPNLTSFDSMTGTLCGNISAASLSQVPMPASLLPGGANPCGEGYSTSNHLLDALVNGCTVLITAISPTQPDVIDPSKPAAGAGSPYTLTVSNKTVTGCKDKNGAAVDFQTCLNQAAYSSFFGFKTDRVIMK